MTIHTLTPARAAELAGSYTRLAGQARDMARRARTQGQRDNWERVARARDILAARYREQARDPATAPAQTETPPAA